MLNLSHRLQLEQTINHLSLPDLWWLLEFIMQRIRVIISLKNASSPQEHDSTGLAQLLAKIQATPPNPANIQPATQSLAEGLAHSPFERDASFEVHRWNKQWDTIEAKMKADELAHEQSEQYSL